MNSEIASNGVDTRSSRKSAIARQFIPAAIVVGGLAFVPSLATPYLMSFIFTILIAYLLAQSWDWVAGEMGYVNLGHYCFYGIGAYVFSLALASNVSSVVSLSWAVGFTVIVAVLVAVPLFRLKGDYFAFGTLALLPLAEILAFNLSPITNGADGVILPVHNVQGLTYLLALAVCAIAFATSLTLNASRFGYALRGIRNDELVLESMGARIQPVKIKVLALSAGFASIAGALQAWQLSYIDPSSVFGLNVALVPIAMALLGGSGLRWGPLVGVLVLALMQQWLLVNVTMLHATVYGAIILVIGRFMPGGLLRSDFVRNSSWLRGLSREHHEFLPGKEDTAAVAAGAGKTDLPLPRIQVDTSRVLLECRGLTMAFGGNIAVNNVDLTIREGEIVGLIGPNGSGKTTLFNCISKLYEPTSGDVLLCGTSLKSLRRDQVVSSGIGRTYQIPRPFGDLTIDENIAIPLMYKDSRLTPYQAIQNAKRFIDYAELSHRKGARADSLSLQEKKALEFARALACKPKILLVDEVASGLTPLEVNRFVKHIRYVRDEFGITVIWVEHIFSALAQVVDRVIVLEQGSVIADGSLSEVIKDTRVISTYLGSMDAGGHDA